MIHSTSASLTELKFKENILVTITAMTPHLILENKMQKPLVRVQVKILIDVKPLT